MLKAEGSCHPSRPPDMLCCWRLAAVMEQDIESETRTGWSRGWGRGQRADDGRLAVASLPHRVPRRRAARRRDARDSGQRPERGSAASVFPGNPSFSPFHPWHHWFIAPSPLCAKQPALLCSTEFSASTAALSI